MADPPAHPDTADEADEGAGTPPASARPRWKPAAAMPNPHTAQAVIQTADPARYIARLRRHTTRMGEPAHRGPRHGHRPPGPSRTHTPPRVTHAEWTGTHGTVTMNWGQWTVQAAPGTLTLRAEAADRENLNQIQDMLTTRLETFGRREHLTLTWRTPG